MSRHVLLGLIVALVSVTVARGQNTWTGAVGGNWNTAGNWQGGTVPASGINTQLIFGATSNASMNNDIAGPFFLLNKLTFSAGDPTYSLSGTALDFRTSGSSVGPSIVMDTNNGVTINNGIQLTNNLTVSGAGTGNLTFNSNLTGAGSLTYSGAGTLTIGASNTHSGGTFVNSGTLALVGFSGVLPPGQNVTIGNGSGPATLNANNVSNNSTAYAIGTLTLNGGTFHAPGGLGGDFYLNQLNMTGGTADLSASPNYVLHFVNAGAAINITGGPATWTGPNGKIRDDTGGPLAINIGSGATLNAGFALTGAGSLFVINGPGNIRLSNTSNTADITVQSGYIYSNDLSSGASAYGTLGSGTFTLIGAARLAYDGGPATSAKPIVLNGGGTIQVSNPGVTLNMNVNAIISQASSGSPLIVFGSSIAGNPSTLALAATNTYSGSTVVAYEAILAIPTIANGLASSPLGASSNAATNLLLGKVDVLGRGDLLLTGTNSSYSTDRGATVFGMYSNNQGGGIGVANQGTTLVWNGPITSAAGTGSLIKTGPGTLTLQNSTNNYAGGTYVEGGTLRVGAAGAIPNGSPLSLLAGTFDTNGIAGVSLGSLAGAAGSVVQNAGVTLTTGSDNSNTTFAGTLTGGTVVKTGSGVLTLTGLGSTANLTTVGVGAIAVSDMNALGTGIVVLQGAGENGGGLLYTGPSVTSGKNLSLASASTIQVKNPGTNLMDIGLIIESAPGQVLIVSGPFNGSGTPSTLTLAPVTANTYTGKTEVFGNGVVAVPTVTNANVPGPLGAFPTTDPSGLTLQNGTLFLTGTSGPYSTDRGVTLQGAGFTSAIGVQDAGTTLTISGELTGPGIFHKIGPGTLVLANGTNNYSGGTFIDAGRLALGNANAIPAGGNVTVAFGATFDAAGVESYSVVGTLALNGGTFRMTNRYVLNNLTTNTSGGTVDATSAPDYWGLWFFGPVFGVSPTITINGNSTWTGPATFEVANLSSASVLLTIAPNVTLTSSLSLSSVNGSPSADFWVTGGGTLYLTNAEVWASIVRVNQARLRMADLTGIQAQITQGFVNFGHMNLTLDNGTLQYSGGNASADSFALANAGGTLEILNAATTLTLTGAIAGTSFSPLTKAGPGTLVLTNAGNTFGGGLTITNGMVQTTNDNTLGQGPITVAAAGTMQYTASTSSSRTFNLNFGTLSVVSGVTLTLNGAAVNGGFMRGAGTFTLTGGTALSGVTTFGTTTLSQVGTASYLNFSNGGTLNIAAGLAAPVSISGFTNQGSGTITVGAGSQVNANDFQTYGVVNVTPGTAAAPTQLINVGGTPMYFNGGSRTFISTVAQVANGNAGIDLHGNDAIVAGGLFVNNGFVYDSVGTGQHRIVADYGALVKGAGFYQPLPRTINGGTFIAGNSPGHATTGTIVLGGPNDPSGGLSDFTWQINDAGPSSSFPSATGTAGPTANAAKQVSGWGQLAAVAVASPVATSGDFRWDATPADKLTIHLQTLLASNDGSGNPVSGGGYGAAGDNTPGPMSDFDATKSYSWRMFAYSGSYSGPTDTRALDATVNLDSSGFLNPHAGRFDLVLNSVAHEMDLIYTPTAVPEPGTLVLTAFGLGVFRILHRRRK